MMKKKIKKTMMMMTTKKPRDKKWKQKFIQIFPTEFYSKRSNKMTLNCQNGNGNRNHNQISINS